MELGGNLSHGFLWCLVLKPEDEAEKDVAPELLSFAAFDMSTVLRSGKPLLDSGGEVRIVILSIFHWATHPPPPDPTLSLS